MVEDDTFTYHVKQQPRNQVNTAAASLITKERTQKLDLLIHLLSNLTQALAVCGPEGIGKTTLLDVLQGRKTESWRYCLVQGNAALSFEAIQQQLAKAVASKSAQSLSTALGRHDGQFKQIVLIVDNAGELVPGLIGAIIQYAAANPVLRVIFALTHDELQMKRGSDRAVDDCHIVEIPPLSEKQCGDFLQYLSAKPSANVSFKAIGENMVAHIYRETHGVPGRIIDEISGASAAKQGGKLKWVLALSAAAALAIAFGVQWLVSPRNNAKEAIAPVSVERTADKTEAAPPRPESQIILTLPPAQPALPQPEQSAPVNEGNEALKPAAEANTHSEGQQPVIPAVNPDASGTIVIKPLPENPEVKVQPVPPTGTAQKPDNKQSAAAQQKIAEPPVASPEKPFSEAVNNVEPSIAENSARKPIPANAVAVERKPDIKQPELAQQNIAVPLESKPEKPKQTELKKTVNSVEPFASNNLETIQIPQKPVEVAAIPEQQGAETAAPQQAEPGLSGSLPIAALSPSPAVEGTLAPSANNFTLQLMVLSKQSSVNAILKKYPAMEPDFRVVRTMANGQEKFILEYGSYPDTVSANKARQSLPFEFHNALVRKISSIKQR
ncbi:MAG: hypothetical protein ACXWT1_21360 [Methylobacter sp.]